MPAARLGVGFCFIPTKVAFDNFVFTTSVALASDQQIIPITTNKCVVACATGEGVVAAGRDSAGFGFEEACRPVTASTTFSCIIPCTISIPYIFS